MDWPGLSGAVLESERHTNPPIRGDVVVGVAVVVDIADVGRRGTVSGGLPPVVAGTTTAYYSA